MLSDKIYDVSDEEIIKKNYLKIKELWDNNEEKIKNLEFDISELYLDEKVNKYLELSNYKQVIEYVRKCEELTYLKKERHHIFTKLSFLHQKLCEHPAYFIIQDFYTDMDEEYYTCCCIECGKGLTKKVDVFDNEVLIYPNDINNAEIEYNEYKKEYKKMMKRVL